MLAANLMVGNEDPRGHAGALLGRALAALPAAARAGRILLRADAAYFAGALARAALFAGVKFAIDAERIAPVWRILSGVAEGDWRPDRQRMRTGPGTAMLDEKLFVVTDTGDLWERHWRADLGEGSTVNSSAAACSTGEGVSSARTGWLPQVVHLTRWAAPQGSSLLLWRYQMRRRAQRRAAGSIALVPRCAVGSFGDVGGGYLDILGRWREHVIRFRISGFDTRAPLFGRHGIRQLRPPGSATANGKLPSGHARYASAGPPV